MEIISGVSSGGGATNNMPRKKGNKPYRGVRMRKWGRWVAEVREPNKRSRLWLGSYTTPLAAARAYDTAVYYLRGPTQAKLNFPDEVFPVTFPLKDLSAASVRKVALEVGTRVDAQLANNSGATISYQNHHLQSMKQISSCNWVHEIDLNKMPEPEDPNLEYLVKT